MRKQDLEALPAWTELGPNNVGGRTRALLIHPTNPSVMSAAGVSGGVWKTVNGGQSWAPLADLMANIAVNSLAMDPRNPEVSYSPRNSQRIYAAPRAGVFAQRTAALEICSRC
jgi:hypothetical protein